MKHLLLILLFLLLSFILQIPNITFAQDRKPPALIGPLVTLGTFTEVQKQIIYNHLQAKLSERFELVSQRRFEEAQNMAFEELDYDQCTEENCTEDQTKKLNTLKSNPSTLRQMPLEQCKYSLDSF